MILAGGLGTRMHPLTLDCPKSLLPVGARTLLEHQVEGLAAAGIDRVVVSTGHLHEAFPPVLERLAARGLHVTVSVEDGPLGTGGGLCLALGRLVDTSSVVVLNGDLLTGHDLPAEIAQHTSGDAAVTLHVREVPDARPFGTVRLAADDGHGSAGMATAFVEKSPHAGPGLVNAGTYVVDPGLLALLPTDRAVSLEREIFPELARRGKVATYREDADVLDVGTPAALVEANRRAVAQTAHPDGALVLAGARVDDGARLGSGTVVHAGCRVHGSARCESAVLLPGAVVGPGAVVTRTVVGRRAVVGAGAELVDSALGTDEQVAAGERVVGEQRPAPPAP